MKNWIIANKFLHSGKFSELADWLIQAAARKGIQLEYKTNSEIPVWFGREIEEQERPGRVIFWDKDIRLARFLEGQGIPVYNKSEAIRICDDKSLTHQILAEKKIPQPDTMSIPMTYDTIGYTDYDFLQEAVDQLGWPMVVKECFGSFGWQVYLAKNREELLGILKKTGTKPVIFQRFIANSSGRDVRIQVAGGRVAASMYRYSPGEDFRANITNGGKMKAYEPDEREREIALAAAAAVGADFAGVDLLFGEEGPLVCEVNSNAHFKNIYQCTGINVADAIIDTVFFGSRQI